MAHAGGRPLKFKSVVQLEELIKAYFKMCDDKILPYTITGLAMALDTSRQTLLEYEGEVAGREEKSKVFADTIKRAKEKCEWYAEKELFMNPRPSGPIFALKNYGWKDKQEHELSGEIKTTPIYNGLSGHNSDQKDIPAKE